MDEEIKNYEVTITIKYDTEAPDKETAKNNVYHDIMEQLQEGADFEDIADVEVIETGETDA